MADRVVLQKLLTVDLSEGILGRGCDWVGGFVIDASGTGMLGSGELLAAYGFDDDPPYVDVVRFPVPVCASLKTTQDFTGSPERPWPTYPHGFLRPVRDTVIPVYELGLTRWPVNSECWRIKPDATQDLVSFYRGVALGWHGAREWRPASPWYGLRARWRDGYYAADVLGGLVELVSFEDPGSAQWVSSRPRTWSRRVPVSECMLHELLCTATWRGVAVRVAEINGNAARVRMTGSDPAQAGVIGATMVDQGVFENPNAPVSELLDIQYFSNELAPTASQG